MPLASAGRVLEGGVHPLILPEGRRMRPAESRTRPTQFARRLFAGLPDRYDRLAEILSMGQDARWRRAMVDRVVAACA